jgi:hypothetical protein
MDNADILSGARIVPAPDGPPPELEIWEGRGEDATFIGTCSMSDVVPEGQEILERGIGAIYEITPQRYIARVS